MSLGFEQAGFDIKAAVEIDPVHACVHKFNFPECTVIPSSVSNLSGDDIIRKAGIKGSVDVVFGGPPCQGFSLIGKRILEDPRNSLVLHFVRLVQELNANYFVFENVKGLTLGEHRKFLDELIEAFDAAGYQIRTPWMVLNAACYGVPQDRRRLFLIGAKKNKNLPHYPNAINTPAGDHLKLGHRAGPSCFDALGDLPDADKYDELVYTDEIQTFSWGESSEYAREMRCLFPEAWHAGYKRDWNCTLLTSSMRTNHSDISKRRFQETKPGQVEPISRFLKLPPDGVSNTLRAGTDGARGAFTSPRPIHFNYPRCITVREMARLHGFPDWFRLHRTKWHGARQVGNSVPPPLARAVAKTVIDAIGIEVKMPRLVVSLGETRLLTMDLSQSSDYWNVPVPASKRDRKSEAKKRSQEETEKQRLTGADAFLPAIRLTLSASATSGARVCGGAAGRRRGAAEGASSGRE